ncbi:MAG: branched-chain amino acid ABC transporter permease [Burkholderiales bacterium]|nr:branched-chain amino acid ABC transporter permease [Burkholderiales bacterium]
MLGGLYGLFAVGLSLVFGVMRIVNIAHGDLIVLAAFGAIVATSASGTVPAPGLPLWIAAPLVVAAMYAFGYILQRGVLNTTIAGGELPPLLVTFGVSIVIQNLLLEFYSADPRSLAAGGLETRSVELFAGVTVGVLPLATLAIALGITAFLQWLFGRTNIGRAFRAASDDPEIAGLMGIATRHVYALATALALAVVAIAGMLLAVRTTVAPADGPNNLIYAFEAVIIGGLGSFWGTLAGGVILGISQAIGFRLSPGWGAFAGHIVFLAILALRPQGLFPRTRTQA